MHPPTDAKAEKLYVESKGVMAEKYDILLQSGIAHMRGVDGALPPAFLQAQGTGFVG